MKSFEIELTIEKKNRKYFAAKNKNNYPVKLLIDSNSEALKLGTQKLVVHDISVRSAYGVDVIYKLASAEEKSSWDNPVTLKAKYNIDLVKECQELAGKWDGANKVWVFSKMVADKVEELDYLYADELIAVEITANVEIKKHGPIDFLGYPVCKATGRDSGSILCEDVAFISGRHDSGGSVKNWVTCVSQGSKFRLAVSRNLIKEKVDSRWDTKIL